MELPDPETLKQAKLHNTFGSVCLRAQHVDRAMPHLIKAVELIPNGFTNAYFNLGNGYAQSKDSENAIKYFEKAIEESPHRQPDCEVPIDDCWNNLGALIEAHTNLAVMYMIENRLEEALEQCEKSIALQPKGEGAEAHINMGNVLRTLNSRESAIDHVWIQVAFLAGKEGKPFTRPELLDVKAHPLPEHDGELHVVCVKWGTKYGADYVNKLYHGVEKFLTLPHKFICFTEDSSGLDEGILVTPLAEDWTGWWGKATLFGDTGYTGRMLYIDLDTVITGSLDDLASYKGAFAVMSTADIWCEMAKDGFNSSIISWHTSFGSQIYDALKEYYDLVLKYICRFDHWLEMMVGNPDLVQELWPNQFCDYNNFCKEAVPEDCRMVCFPRDPKPHNAPAKWIEELWV